MSGSSREAEFGAGDRCTVCGATGAVARDHDGYACQICGAPRVPVAAAIDRPRGEKALLERAKRSKLVRAGWGVAASLGIALGGAVLAVGALTSLFIDYGATAQAALGSLVVTPLFFSALGFYKSRRAGRDARTSIEAAESLVASELIRARGGAIEANELARLLGVSVERAEHLVATAQIDRMLESDTRFRVEEAPVPSGAETEASEAPAAAKERR